MKNNAGRNFPSIALLVLVLYSDPSPAMAVEPVQIASYNEEALLFSEIPSVIGASKYEQKVTEAPSSVSIVTSAEIKKFGYRTLAGILRSVRSFYVTYDRDYSYVGVRGFGPPGDYNTRILLLIDGHRTNDNTYDHALIGTEGILDVDLIDRVEVIRGPGSSLYGSNAFFAVVNIITKRGRDLKGTEVSGEAGSYNTAKGRASYGNRFSNGVEAIVSGSLYNSDGQNHYFPEYGGAANNADYDRYRSFFTKISHYDMTLASAYVSRTKGIPTGAFGTDFGDPGNKTIDEHAYIDLKYDHKYSGWGDVAARLYYDYYRYAGDYLYYTTLGTSNKDFSYGDWWGGEIRLAKNLFDVHYAIIGAEYRGNLRQDQKNYYADGSGSWEDKRKSRMLAVYAQDEASLSKKTALTAGVRYDHYSDFGGTTNPRLALIYNPMEKSAIKLLYGSAFRMPNNFERYYMSLGTNIPNPDLKPEKIKTYEVVYEHYLGERFRASVSGYFYDISNLISQSTSTPTFFRNAGEVTARGFELELDNKWANGLDGRISYTLQRAKDKLTGQPLPNSPAQLVKLNMTIPLVGEKLFASLEDQYLSRRRIEGGACAGAFHVVNVTFLGQEVLDRFELSGSVYNIFDKEYSDPVSKDLAPIDRVRQNGRNYRLKLTYAF